MTIRGALTLGLATLLSAPAIADGSDVRTAMEQAYADLRAQPKAQVMVLGSFHFHQNSEFDGLSTDRQQEIAAIVDRLAQEQFTVVATECVERLEEGQNSKLAALNDGESSTLTENENDQIGVRLASALGLSEVHCIDTVFPPTPSYDSVEGDWNTILAYGEERGETAHFGLWLPKIEAYFGHATAIQSEAPLAASLNMENTIGADYSEGRMLLLEAAIGIEDKWYGPDWLGRFEGRNARMFAKINAASDPGDRVLVFVGTAHKRPLERLFKNSFEFDVIDVPRFSEPGDED